MKAEIDVGTIIVSGTVEGNISAKKMVELKAPALVRGTITTPALMMEQGVVLEGAVKMEERAKKGASTSSSSAPKPASAS